MLTVNDYPLVVLMLQHFNQPYAIIFDSIDDEVVITTDYQTIMSYAYDYTCDLVELFDPHGRVSIQKDNLNLCKVITESENGFMTKSYLPYDLIPSIVHCWMRQY